MAEERTQPEHGDPVREIRLVTPPADDEEGGDPVCWAFLVCEECGAITTEGHRQGCSRRSG